MKNRHSATPPYSCAGSIPQDKVVLSLLTRLKVVARVPDEIGKPGQDIDPSFEPKLRRLIAETLVGLEADGLIVDYAAVEQFESE